MKITVADMRKAGICRRAKHYLEGHGHDWRDFVRNGIDSEVLRAHGDIDAHLDRLEPIAAARIARDGD